MKQKITVLGDGAWGTAIAHTLATAKNSVTLWCYDATVAQDITSSRENKKYLPDIKIHSNVIPTMSLEQALDARIIFVAIPVAFLRNTLMQCMPYTTQQQSWVFLSKGIEQNTLAVSSTIAQETVNPTTWAVLAGPSYARDLAQNQITGFTYAGKSPEFLHMLKTLFPSFCTFEYSNDTQGIQLYGALKNILALGIGIIEGAGYTDNTKALFFTRVFNEITLLIEASDGNKNSYARFAGIGDALLSGYGALSKNKKLGLLLGSGKSMLEALKEFSTPPEGVNTIKSAQQLIMQKQIATPLLETLYNYVQGTADLPALIHALIA